MLRLATNIACRWSATLCRASVNASTTYSKILPRNLSSLSAPIPTHQLPSLSPLSLSCNPRILTIANSVSVSQNRGVTKFSMRSGKRKSVKAALKRFYRLDWGIWIRTRTGRHKHMWRKSANQKRRLRKHVFVNSTQAWMLDKMVTKFWRTPKYYVDDPYRPYHSREECFYTKKRTDYY
ncbi:39S ribosomal protein L35, mitochondrial [Phlebotomus papatasi]|uniref:39S ribosomal protein L35, mitochondrial n=1 Tax=Phlebotomus papatasi TaxID=29031 RepID=UPI0024834B46|nr:39S ribosomal protein L35, mitochondrial [Phlebotomus papatasi]